MLTQSLNAMVRPQAENVSHPVVGPVKSFEHLSRDVESEGSRLQSTATMEAVRKASLHPAFS